MLRNDLTYPKAFIQVYIIYSNRFQLLSYFDTVYNELLKKITLTLLNHNSSSTSIHEINKSYNKEWQDFPGGAVVKNLPANAGDMGSSPGPGRSHMPQNN